MSSTIRKMTYFYMILFTILPLISCETQNKGNVDHTSSLLLSPSNVKSSSGDADGQGVAALGEGKKFDSFLKNLNLN